MITLRRASNYSNTGNTGGVPQVQRGDCIDCPDAGDCGFYKCALSSVCTRYERLRLRDKGCQPFPGWQNLSAHLCSTSIVPRKMSLRPIASSTTAVNSVVNYGFFSKRLFQSWQVRQYAKRTHHRPWPNNEMQRTRCRIRYRL